MDATPSTNLAAFARRQRPTQAVRLARAAKVLRRFDLQMLMLAAQVPNMRTVRLWLSVHVDAGDIAGPQLRGRRNVQGLEWTMPSSLAGPRA